MSDVNEKKGPVKKGTFFNTLSEANIKWQKAFEVNQSELCKGMYPTTKKCFNKKWGMII